MKKFIIKATTLAGVGTLLVTGALPVNAEDTTSDGTTKDESVYVVLNADGSVSSVTVSDQLHNANGFSNYQDKSDLKDVQNLKSDDPVQSSSDGYKWTTTDTDIYYQGKTTKALPLDTTIEYKLDGKTVDPKDIVGKSGHLSMTFNIKNTQTKQYTIDGKTYTVCQPFYVAAGGMLDQDHFTNVKIDHGTVSTDTSHSIALAVMMPGMKDSIGQFLTGDLSSLNDYLFDTITIEADVTDFESPTMMMAASTDLSALKGELKDDGAFDTTDLFDQLDKLDDATKQLIDGASALYDGADQLASGAKDLDTGAGTLNDGAQSLLDGIASLNNGTASLVSGASRVDAGASELASSLNTLNSYSADLNNATQQIAGEILNTINAELTKQGFSAVNLENYGQELKNDLNVTDTMIATVKEGIKSNAAQKGFTLSDDQVDLAVYMAYMNNTGSDFNTDYVKNNLPEILGKIMIADADVQSAQKTLSSTIYDPALKQISDQVSDPALAKQILTYAIMFDYGQSNDNPQEGIKTAASAAGKDITLAKAEVNKVQQTMDKYHDKWFKNSVQTVMSSANVDQATASGIISYAWNIYDASKGYDQNAWLAAITQAEKELNDQTNWPASDDLKLIKKYVMTANTDVQNQAKTGFINAIYNVIIASVKNDQQSLNTAKGKQDLLYAETLLVQQSDEYKKADTSLDEVQKNLDKLHSFVQSVSKYTAGVASAASGAQKLAEGTDQLNSGAQQLQSGASQLQTGAESLKNGTQSLKDGTSKLSSGADSLKDGAGKLKDGLQQYNDEGISKLTENSDLDNLQTASKLISDIQNDDDAYVNYSGISDGTDGTVKFIYKISTVKSEADTEKDAASKSDDTSDVQESSDKGNFFTRLADLFIFWN